MSPSPCLTLVVLCFMVALNVPLVDSLKCWEGSSSESAIDYPPADTDCSINGYVCELAKTDLGDLYNLMCTSSATCQRHKSDLENNPATALYSEVTCCTEDHCNAYPGQDDDDEENAAYSNMKACMLTLTFFLSVCLTYPLVES